MNPTLCRLVCTYLPPEQASEPRHREQWQRGVAMFYEVASRANCVSLYEILLEPLERRPINSLTNKIFIARSNNRDVRRVARSLEGVAAPLPSPPLSSRGFGQHSIIITAANHLHADFFDAAILSYSRRQDCKSLRCDRDGVNDRVKPSYGK